MRIACRRSPTCRRSSASSSTSPTRISRTSARRGSASRRSSRSRPRSPTRFATRRARTYTNCRSAERSCCARSPPPARRNGVELLRPSSVEEVDGGIPVHGGTEVVPLVRDGILEGETLVDLRSIVPRGVRGNRIGAGTTLAELEVDPQIPEALRQACTLAASPQLRNMGSVGGNLLQATRCWYWRVKFPWRLHSRDRWHAREGAHPEHAIFGNERCA